MAAHLLRVPEMGHGGTREDLGRHDTSRRRDCYAAGRRIDRFRQSGDRWSNTLAEVSLSGLTN